MHLRTVALRSLLARPGRTLFSILGIAMGIAIVVGIFTLDHNTLLGLKGPGDPDWQADLRVSPEGGITDPRAELAAIPGVAGVAAFFQNEADLIGAAEDRPARVRLIGIESSAVDAPALYRVLAGRGLAPGGVLIGAALAESRGLGPGDAITLTRPKRGARRICVDGEMKLVEPENQLEDRRRSYRVLGVLAPERLGRRSGGDVVLLDIADARDLFADLFARVDYLVEKDPKVDIERLTSSLGHAFSFELNQDVLIGQAADERAFRNGVRFAGLMALGLGLYVIFHVLSIALVERSREIATLQALGATRRQVAGLFLGEALVLALGGGLFGLGGGIGLARLLLALRITTLGAGRHIDVFEIPWATILPLAAIGCGIALLGSVYPLLRMRRAQVARAIRGERNLDQGPGLGFRLFAVVLVTVALPLLFLEIAPVVGEQKEAIQAVLRVGIAAFAVLLGLPLLLPGLLGHLAALVVRLLGRVFPLGALVAAREIGRRPLRLAVGAAVLAMVAAAYTALQGITASLEAEIDRWAAVAVAPKLFVGGLDGREVAEVDRALAGIPGLIAHEKGDLRAYVPFLLTGVDEKALLAAKVFADPERLDRFLGGRGLVVSTRLARDQKLAVGSRQAIRTGRGQVESFEVLAISDAVGFFPYPDERIYAVTTEETMRRDFCLDTAKADRLALVFEPGRDAASFGAAVSRALTPPGDEARAPLVIPGAKVAADARLDVARDFVLFDVIILLTAALGGLGVLNGQLLSALERAKELGVLKSLGCTRRQMAGLVLVEAATIGLLGGLLGAALGLLLNPVVIEALQIVSAFDLPLVNLNARALLAALGAIVVSLLAAIYPMVKVMRMPTARAIREG